MKRFSFLLMISCLVTGYLGCTKYEENKPVMPACFPRISYGSSYGKLDSTMRSYKYEYDAKQRPVKVTVINGDRTEQTHEVEYDNEGRVSEVVKNMHIYGTQISYNITYNSKGQMESIVHPTKKLKYMYQYDETGRCISLNIYKDGNTNSIMRLKYEYTGATIKETMEIASDPAKSDLSPYQIYIHDFYEQEDKLSYVKQYYFPSHFEEDRFGSSLEQISYELGDKFYPFDPVYRFSKKMLKKTTIKSATQEFVDATADYQYEYTVEGFPAKRTVDIINAPIQSLSVIAYTCK